MLRRKVDEGFKVGDDVEIVIAKIEGDRVYVAIKAPNKRVVRNEIADNEPREQVQGLK